MEAPELEPLDLDEDFAQALLSTTARAALSASTCSRTSWARMIDAPCSYGEHGDSHTGRDGPGDCLRIAEHPSEEPLA